MREPPADPAESGDVQQEVDELGDPEAYGAIPSASLARRAAAPTWAGRALVRRETDRELWELAWPAMLSLVFGAMVSLIDIAMVGRLGTEALAAVGYATQYLFLSQSVLFAVGAACVAMMSRALGAGEADRARQSLAATLLLAGAAGLVLACIVVAWPRPLLAILAADPGIMDLAVPYFLYTLGPTALLAVAVVYESAFRAARDTRTPLWITSGVTLVKILFNALLIFGLFGFPRMGLAGAGLATLISQVVAVIAFLVASRTARADPALRVSGRDFVVSMSVMGEVLRISAPAVAERVVLNAAIMSYFALLGTYGNHAVAAYTLGVRVLAFSWIPGSGFSIAASTLVGQALGAFDPASAGRAGWRAARLTALVSLVLGVFYAVAAEPIASFFTSDPMVVAAATPFMLCLALAQPVMGVQFTLGGALRGAGDTVTPLVGAFIGNWALRVPIAFLCARVLEVDLVWVWSALVADHFARCVWMVWCFHRGRWRTRLGV